MNRTWFHGVDHLLLWLMSAAVLCSLNLAFYEMGSKDYGYFPEDVVIPKEPEYSHRNVGKKIFIVFVEGLTTGNFIRNIHKSRGLTKVVIQEGVWGEISWEPPPAGFIGFEPFFTGNPEGHGPSVLAAADRVTFIGKPDIARGLKLPSNYTQLFNPTEAFESADDYSSQDEKLIDYTIQLAQNKELWDPKLEKQAVILHLTTVGLAFRKEGTMSLKGHMALHDTFDLLDKLFTHIRKEYTYVGTTYFVTSVGMQVPVLAWGDGIDTARFPESRLYENHGYSVPTVPRNMDVISMAPLIACIMSTPIPPNSIGNLPEQYLGIDKSEIALCQSKVAEGVKKLYYNQAQHVLKGGWVKLAVFDEREVSSEELEDSSRKLRVAMQSGNYESVESISKMLVADCLENIIYYRNFRYLILSNITLFMLIGCLLCCMTLLCPAFAETANMDGDREWLRLPSLKPIPTLDAIFVIAFTILLIIVGIDNFPARYHLYVTATVVPWWLAIRNTRNWLALIHRGGNQRGNAGKRIIEFVYFILILLTGSSIANRVPIMGIYLVSMVFLCLTALITSSDSKVTLWMFTTVPMVASLSFNYDKDLAHKTNILVAFLWIIISWGVTYYSSPRVNDYPIVISNSLIALIIVFGKGKIVYHFAWLVLAFIPFIGSRNLMTRFVQIFMSVGIPFFLLTTNGEPANLIVLIVHSLTWMIAESYDDLNDLVVQTIPTERRLNGRRYSPMDMRMNYFYNLYAMLSAALAYPDKYNDECTLFSPVPCILTRLLNCEFKLAVPILCLTAVHVHMVERNGGQRYYSLLLSFFYFTYMILFSFLDTYKSSWNESMESSHELNLVHGPLNVWGAVLACSWIADFLLCPPILSKGVFPPQLPRQCCKRNIVN